MKTATYTICLNEIRKLDPKIVDKYKSVYSDLKEISMYYQNLDQCIKYAITEELI